MIDRNARSLSTLAPVAFGSGSHFTGTTGDDTQPGTADADVFNYGQGGNDSLTGLFGDDVFKMGAAFNAADHIDGGADNDTVILNGDYFGANALTLADNTLVGVETIRFATGNSYTLTTANGTIASGETVTFDAGALGSGDDLTLDTHLETDGNVVAIGGDAFDHFTLGTGVDTVNGGGGNDTVQFGRNYTVDDTVNGGSGVFDQVLTFFGVDTTLNFKKSSLKHVESFVVGPAANIPTITITVVMNDANVAAGETLSIHNSGAVNGSAIFNFDGSREKDGHFFVSGYDNNDTIVGGALHDEIGLYNGGNDTVSGMGGDDTINAINGGVVADFTVDDRIDGGAGFDTLQVFGGFIGTLDPETIRHVEEIQLMAGASFDLRLDDANVAKGQTMVIDARGLNPDETLSFGTDDTDSVFEIHGGPGDDRLTGGGGDDTITGGAGDDNFIGSAGADFLTGNGGSDIFDEGAPFQSTGRHHDTIDGFDTSHDRIGERNGVDKVDAAVTHGDLSNVSFNNDLSAAVGHGELGPLHAVLFTPDGGDLAGHVFLVIDDNGVRGYQGDAGNADYVVELTDALHLDALSKHDFIRVL